MGGFKVNIQNLPDKQGLQRKPLNVNLNNLPDKPVQKPVEEKGFFERQYDKVLNSAKTLGETILGSGAIKKAPEKPAIIENPDNTSTREVFLKNASKQLYGTTPENLSDDPFQEHYFLRNVTQVATQQENQYKDVLKSDKPWEEKSKELTKLNEDYTKPYLKEKNNLNSQLEEVNYRLSKIKTLSTKVNKEGVFYPDPYTEDEFLSGKKAVTLADFGNEEQRLIDAKNKLEKQLANNEKDKDDLQKTLTSPAYYLHPTVEKTRNNPDELLSLSQEDFGFQLAKMQAEVESMDNEEKKQGRLYPYTTSINGTEIKDLLGEKLVLSNSKLFNWFDNLTSSIRRDTPTDDLAEEYIEEKLGAPTTGVSVGGVIRKIQEDAYNGANTLEANIEANKKSYLQAIKDLQNFKLEQLKEAKEKNQTVSPEWENEINSKISEYSDLLSKQDDLLRKTQGFKDTYLKSFKEFEDYKSNRDNYAKSWNILDDFIEPAILNPSVKIASTPQALSTYKDAALTSVGLMSKEEQVARQLATFYSNEANPFTYIPEPIKSEQAFKLKEGQGISDITIDNFNLRATAREGIKTTIESLLLYQSGVYIGELSGASNLLSKGGKIAKYFSDKVGIIPASNLLLNQDIQKENTELYLQGVLNNINEVVGRTEAQKMIEGATEMLWTPEANLLKAATKEPLQEFALKQLFKKALGESLVTPELKYLAQSVVKNLVATPLEESFEEVAGNKATDWLNKYSKSQNLKYNPEEQFTLLGNFETAVNTTLGMLPTMLFGLGKSYTDRYKYLSSLSYEIGANADEIFKYAQDYILSADEKDLKKIFPNYTNRQNLINKVLETNNEYKKAYEDAAPITSKMLSEAQKIDYFNTIYTYNQLVKDPEKVEQNLDKINSTQLSILKIKDGVQKREQAYKEDYKKALSKDLPTILASFDYGSVNIPTLTEISNYLENLKDKFTGDSSYKEEVDAISQLQRKTNAKISTLKEAAVELSKTPEERAAENNQKQSVNIVRPDIGSFNLEFNTPYYLSSIDDTSVEGAKIKQRPLIQILQDNGDGTIKISSNGEVTDIPLEQLSQYKFTRQDTVEKWRKTNSPEAFVFDHENDVFTYEFAKETESRGKTVKGRIQYNPLNKTVEFVYKDKKGVVQKYTLSKSDLKNVNKGKFKFVRTLETEQEFNEKQSKIQEAASKTDFEQLENQTLRRWEFIKNFIAQKQSALESTKELIFKIEDELLNTEIEIQKFQEELSKKEKLTTVKGSKRVDVQKLFNKLNNLQQRSKELQWNLTVLEQQKTDLESQIEYTKQYEDVEFESEKSLVDQLIEDQFKLEVQLEQVNSIISGLRNLVLGIENTIRKLLDNIDALFNIAQKIYPNIPFDITKLTDFVRQNPNINKLQPEAFSDISQFNDIINNNLEKIELEDKKVENLTKSIKANIDIAKKIQDKIRYQEELINNSQLAQNQFQEEKNLNRLQSIAEQIFKSQKETQTENNVAENEEDKKLVSEESDKIDLSDFFSTTTSGVTFQGFNLDRPHILRLQNFLNSVEHPERVSLLVITKDNAKKYGLESIIFSDENTTNKTDNEEDNDIVLVFVLKDDLGNIHFLNEKNEIIDTPTPDQVVYTSLRKASTKWNNGEKAYVNKLNQTEEEESKFVAELEQAHRKLRQDVVNAVKAGNNAVFSIKYISRGRNTQETKLNPVSVLSLNVNLANQQVIQIPQAKEGKTAPVVYSGNKAIPMPIGRPVLSYNQHFEFLQALKFSKKDIDKFVKVFKALYDSYKSGNSKNVALLTKYLQKTLYFRNPESISKLTNKKQESPVGRSQIWFTYEGNTLYLNLSDTFKIPFNFEESNPSAFIAIQSFFQGKDNKGIFHNVDNQKLIGEPFVEVVDISKDGEIKTREWKSYQEYLLSDKYPDGSQRPTEEIPLTVNVNPSTPNTPNKAGRYIVFDNKSNQTVVSSAKQTVVQTKKENIVQPTVQINENTEFEESKSENQDPTKLTPNKFYRWKGKEDKFVDFTVNDKGFVTVIAHNFGVAKDVVAKNLRDYVSGKEKKPATAVIYELTPLPTKATFTPIKSEEDTGGWGEITKQSTSPVEPTEEGFEDFGEILKMFDQNKSNSEKDINYRKASKKTYKLENLEAAKKWFEERFPQIEFRLVFGLIDGKAWGRLKDKIVTLSDVAEEGTIYHEAFEVVYNYILTPAQKRSLHRKFKERKGSFVDYETGKTVEYSKATDYQIKEQLAEEYREYVLTGKKWQGEYTKNSFFRKLRDFVDFILNGLKNPDTLNEIFDKISNAAYKDYALPFQTESINSSYKAAEIKKTNPVFFNDIMKSMTNIMFEVLREQDRSIPEILLNNYDIEAEQSLIKSKIDRFYGGQAALNMAEKSKESFIQAFKNTANLAQLLNQLSKSTPSFYNNLQQHVAENKLNQLQVLEKLYDSFNNYKFINDNWDELKQNHRKYLAKYSIEFKEQESETNDDTNLNEDKNQNDYTQDTLKLSRKLNANTEIKLLIATLRELVWEKTDEPFFVLNAKRDKKPVLNTLLMSNLVDYNATIINLIYKLAPATTIDEMEEILKKEAVYNASLDQLIDKLKVGVPANQLSEFDMELRSKFFTSMNNMQVQYKKLILDPQTRLGAPVDLNEENAFNIIKNKWFNATKGNTKLFKINKEGNYTLNKSALPITTIKNLEDAVVFLNSLGYEYNIDLSKLSKEDKDNLLKSSLNLFKVLTTNDPELLMYNSPLVRENLNDLADIYIKYTDFYTEPQHLNIDREPVQNIILHNFIGSIAKSFNISKTFEDFIAKIPQLNPNSEGNAWLSFSQILSPNSEFFNNGNRTKKLSIEILEGSEVRESGKGVPTSKLSLIDRVAQEFAFNLQGVYYILTPADTKTEWGINFGHFVTQSQAQDDVFILNLFKNYLKAEILTVQQGNPEKLQNVEKAKNSLRFFKDILKDVDIDLSKSPEQAIKENEFEINQAILSWIEDNTNSTLKEFTNNNIITDFKKSEDNELSYSPIEEDNSTDSKKLSILFAPSNFIKNGLSEQEIKDLIRFANLNYTFNIFEQHKLFWGDPAQWKHITKRVKSFTSGRNLSVHSDTKFNDFYNKFDNTLSYIDKEGTVQTLELEPGDFGYSFYEDNFKTQTYQDITVENSNLPGYDDINEADAQGWAFPTGYRQIRRRANTWTKADQEQFEWDNALCRKDNNLYPKGEKGEKLRAYDDYILSLGNPFLEKSKNKEKTPVTNVLKPIYSGFKDGNTATVNLDKLSLAPLTWRLVKGTQAEKFYLEHFKQGTTYIKVESANKTGLTNPTPLYKNDGTLNTEINPENLNFKYFGIQVETSTQKNKTTLGTQLTKLITMNIDKIKNKILVDNNSKYLSALKTMAKNSIFKEFGIVEKEINGEKVFEFKDFYSIENLIQRELNNRDATENLKEAMKVNPLTGNFYLKWDLVIGSDRLEAIITSIIDNNILRPKMFGGQMPQISSTLFERNPRIFKKTVNGKPVFTSNELKFYEDATGKRYCEVYLPFYMKEFISKGKELSISDIPDDLKFGVGFRIPTQNLNSIENFKIKGFLPVEYGNSIVVPSEITKKAGSDFDIDKLNIYLYNYRVNLKTGKPEKIKFLDDSNSTASERYDLLYKKQAKKLAYLDNLIAKDYEKNVLFNESDPTSNKLWDAIFGKLNQDLSEYTDEEVSEELEEAGYTLADYRKLEEKVKEEKETRPSFEEFSKLPIEQQNSKKAVENAYIDNIRDILQLPEMFKYLIQPNSAEKLKEQSNQIDSLYGENKETEKSDYYLSRLNNAKDRHAFLVGKDAVGIGASQQVQNAIGQLVDLAFTELKESFKLDFPTNSQDLGEGVVKYSLSEKVDRAGETISDTISMFIDAFVDIAKDPYIFNINGNVDTASIYITGVRLGIPLPLLTRWFNQPIIREYIKLYQQNKSISTELKNSKLRKKEIIEKLSSDFKLGEPKERNKDFTEKELEGYIKEYVKNPDNTSQEFKDAQQALLSQFIQLQDLSWDLFRFGQAINLDTSRTVSFESIRIKMAKVATALEGRFAPYVKEVYKNLFIGAIYEAKLDLLESIKPLYLTESDKARSVLNPILNNIYNSIGKQLTLEEEAKKLRKHFITYLLHTVPVKIGNQETPTYLTSYIKDLLLSDKNIALRLRNIQNAQEETKLPKNFFTKNLLGVIPSFVKAKQKTHNIRPLRKMSDKIDSDLATSDFLNLGANPQTENFMFDLVRTALLQSGLNTDPFSISQLIPNDIFQDIANQVDGYFNNANIDQILSGFMDSYYKNQWYNPDLVPKASNKKSTIDKNTGQKKDRAVKWVQGYKPFLEYFVESDTSERPIFSKEAQNPFLLVKTLKQDVDGTPLYSKYEREQMAKKGDFSFMESTLYKRLEIHNPETGKNDIPLAKKHYFKDRQTGLDVNGYIILYYPVDSYGEKFNLVEHYSTPEPSKINENQTPINPVKLYSYLKSQGKMSDRFVFQHIFPNLEQDSEDFITILDKTLNPEEENWTEENNNCGI